MTASYNAENVRLMGILNVTPDSFSDGGKYLAADAAFEHAVRLEAEGADIIDMGAESSRPGSAPVSPREQLRRLLPVLKEFRRQSKLAISIDTCSARVAAACLAEGVDIINDISALRHDPALLKVLSRARCQVVLMHMQGTPRTMQRAPRYKDVVADIIAFLRRRMAVCENAGISAERIILDPGIGFGKTLEHNLEILRRLREFSVLGRPLAVGVSRKSFLGALTSEPVPAKRVAASIAAGLHAARVGAAILRVHDVAAHRAALRVAGVLLETADERR